MYIYNLNILTYFLSMKMNKTHCYIVQILCSFFVDSVFEGKMKHRINFGQPYWFIIEPAISRHYLQSEGT